MPRRTDRDRVPVLKFRPTLAQRLSVVAGALVGAAVGVLTSSVTMGDPLLNALLHVLPGFFGVFLTLPFGWSKGADLTPKFIDAHGVLRSRRIPWNQIVGIHIEKTLTGRRVVIYEYDGRRTRLRAPISVFLSRDRRFEEKFHTIERQWAAAGAIEPSDAVPRRRINQ
jgi:hypothetical protein